MYNNTKLGLNHYKQARAHSKSVCEQIAFLLDFIAKTIVEFEAAYAQKDYAKGADLCLKAIDIATGLSGILMPGNDLERKNMEDTGLDWQEYFADLIQTIVRINNGHNEILTKKITTSLKEMSEIWRQSARSQAYSEVQHAQTAQQTYNSQSIVVDV